MYIRRSPGLENFKYSRGLFLLLILFNTCLAAACAQQPFIIPADKACGAWQKSVVTGRKAISTDKPKASSEIQLNLIKSGKYQLFAYVHHNWRKAVPHIYVEALDADGKLHAGYHKIENIWYLDNAFLGRWFFVSLSQGDYWQLPEGRLNIRFWPEARADSWQGNAVAMEGPVSIENFFLLPMQESGNRLYMPWLINPELAKGNWKVLDYQPAYATNLLESSDNGDSAQCFVEIPISGYYSVSAALFSSAKNKLAITLNKGEESRKINMEIAGLDTWRTITSDPVYLNEGRYAVVFDHLASEKVMIDYLILSDFSNFKTSMAKMR